MHKDSVDDYTENFHYPFAPRKGLHIDTRPHANYIPSTVDADEYFTNMEQPMPVPLPNTRASGLITADGSRITADTDTVPSLTSSATTASPDVDDDVLSGSAPLLRNSKQKLDRRCQSLATSPHTPSWGQVKSPAASFLARFNMPDHLTKKENEDEEVDDYMLEKVIGCGGFATVRRGYCISNGQKVAIKVYKKDHDMKRLERELAIWKRLQHGHILPLHKTIESDNTVYAVCDYCPGGSLLDLVRRKQRLTEEEARPLFVQLCESIQYLHDEQRVCHKDIKLENVLLDENNQIKLCDFGLALYAVTGSMHDDDDEVAGGSLAYSSPEQVLSRTPVRTTMSDMWSLGVLLYTLVNGRLPFQDNYDPRLQQKILGGQVDLSDELSGDLRTLLSSLLQVDPAKRYTIQQVLQSAWCS
ncbi:kinase-like domain-containing protein [Fennellomyces sp. T-0311]|nr:kinase-like domain-containing protein [Fennellomyces sp. T-0311]